ncbi:universal stress protein [Rubinisphaera italica]|uniref:Universal stress protein UspE n=1 Tax=Rubinisphaera italica TaxID=2527969 RepID=A0A5C5XA67_9PLAN|nr:universal stress protein [Rubinisphaera italica]TWT59668.1 universal stress protein UspE [Rubinisphaera italica]
MKILLAYDGSEQSKAAGKFLRRFFYPTSDPIEIVCVIDALRDHSCRVLSDLQNEADLKLEAIQREFQVEDWNVETKRHEGEISKTLMKEAEVGGATLLVAGDRGLGKIDSLLLGNVSSHLVKQANCSVLIAKKFPEVDSREVVRILFPYDGSRAAESAVQWIESTNWRIPVELMLLNVMESQTDHMKKMAIANATYGELDALRIRLDKEMTTKLRRVETEVIEDDNIDKTILNAAVTWNADLILLGHHGHNKLIEHMLGSTAYHIAEHASCSVLVIR